MTLEVFEIGIATELADGRYTKGQVHAAGGKYSELQGLLPRHDGRYKAVHVKDGLVVGVEIEDESAKAAPVQAATPSIVEAAAEAITAEAPAAKSKKPIFFGKK